MQELWRHYSFHPIKSIYNVEQTKDKVGVKPVGLWISADHYNLNWPTWCENNDFSLGKIVYDIFISPKCNLLNLSSEKDMDDFVERHLDKSTAYWNMFPDWKKISDIYDGILIAPFISTRAHSSHTLWYNTWDCASGVIWNKKAISEIKRNS